MTDQAEIDALLAEAESLAESADVSSKEGVAGASLGEGPSAQSEGRLNVPPELRRLLRIRIPLIVRLAEKTMPISQIMTLAPGAIIEFDKNCEDPLDVLTSNHRIGYGSPVKVGENFGVRVTSIINVKSKLQAMGG